MKGVATSMVPMPISLRRQVRKLGIKTIDNEAKICGFLSLQKRSAACFRYFDWVPARTTVKHKREIITLFQQWRNRIQRAGLESRQFSSHQKDLCRREDHNPLKMFNIAGSTT